MKQIGHFCFSWRNEEELGAPRITQASNISDGIRVL
jgi:hypothetical protein